MKLLNNIQEYVDAWNRIRSKYNEIYSNIYFGTDYLKKIIDAGKVRYLENDSSIQMLVDDEFCLHFFYFGVPDNELLQVEYDKPILCKNVFLKDNQQSEQLMFERKLSERGFLLDDSAYVISADVESVYEKNRHMEMYLKILQDAGFSITYIDETYFDDIYRLLEDADFIKRHQYPSRETTRMLSEINGLSAVLNSDGELAGIMFTEIKAKSAEGLMTAIRKDYLNRGLGTALCFERIRYMKELGVKKLTGSVDVNNLQSQKMFLGLGYSITSKMTNEWLLQ